MTFMISYEQEGIPQIPWQDGQTARCLHCLQLGGQDNNWLYPMPLISITTIAIMNTTMTTFITMTTTSPGDPMDARPNPSESDGKLPAMESVWSSHSSGKTGLCNKFQLNLVSIFNSNPCQACNIPRVCKLFSRELRRERYLYTCKECPQTYPWIKNEFGLDFYKKWVQQTKNKVMTNTSNILYRISVTIKRI